MKKDYLFTSESVSEGHPDKVCDRISDMVVDTYLAAEPQSRVACETLTTTNKVVLAGEVRGPEIKKEDLIEKVRHCIKDIGYDQEGFTWKEATSVESHLHSQSADIAMGVDSSGNKDEGAGDQGIMFGYACNETDVLMPAPIHYSHKILRLMAEDRKSGKLLNIEPDSKSQITIEYKSGKPSSVKSVVISTQHSPDVNQSQVRDLVKTCFLSVIKIQYLEDYQNNNLKNPSWRDMTSYSFNSIITKRNKTVLCRIVPYNNASLKLDSDMFDRFGIENKYFFISKEPELDKLRVKGRQIRDGGRVIIERKGAETVSYTHLTLPTNREV